DTEKLREIYEGLEENDVYVSPVDHGISKALYFDDPDGNGIEVYVDTRSSAEEEWHGRGTQFDPAETE
ncbi:MAG: biphenyl-2,3-diol 1,2-dioxygenase, partial [Halobacteria archaeon]|nr:biphenyl-2,3-diol 1,2-dioxygenase [Halobacteria archaeon]